MSPFNYRIDRTHAPADAKPTPAMKVYAGERPETRVIMWVHDHGHEGWQVVEYPWLCDKCGIEIVVTNGTNTCPCCGETYF